MLGPARLPRLDPGVLRLGADLRRVGVEPSRGEWHHVRHGVWVPEPVWADLVPEHRHAALVHATALRCSGRRSRLFCAESAAAVWGLPRIEAWPRTVRVLVHDPMARASSLIRPCWGPESEAVELDGIRVTPVARTVVDLARTGTLASAVAAADHALRHGLCTADDLAAEVTGLPPSLKGRPAAVLVRDLADPLSMSAGESLSRVQMFLFNLPRPVLQQRHTDALGVIGDVDFDWDGVVGEFDGRVKYRVPEGADARRAGEVVWREKQREDRLRRRNRVARWVWAEALDGAGMLSVLTEVGIRPQPRSTWFDLGRHTG